MQLLSQIRFLSVLYFLSGINLLVIILPFIKLLGWHPRFYQFGE